MVVAAGADAGVLRCLVLLRGSFSPAARSMSRRTHRLKDNRSRLLPLFPTRSFSSCSGPSGFVPGAGAATVAGLLVGFPGEGELDLIAFSERSEVHCAYSQGLDAIFFLFGPTCNCITDIINGSSLFWVLCTCPCSKKKGENILQREILVVHLIPSATNG
jgi:hypothetical protein